MEIGNPAKRLQDLISKVSEYKDNTGSRAVWAEVFGIKDVHSPYILIKYAEAMQLVDESVNILKKDFPTLSDMTHHWSTAVRTAFINQNFHGTINSFTTHISKESKNYLSAASLMISTKYSTTSEDTLNTIKDHLRSLCEEIRESALEPKVMEYCLKSIATIINKLDEYWISGEIPVVYAIERTIGHAMIDGDFQSALTTPIGKKLIDALHAVASAVTVVTPIASPVLALLGYKQTNAIS